MLRMLKELRKVILEQQNAERAITSQRFFKTGKGQYGEGDVFVGLTAPQSRIIAKQYRSISHEDLDILLRSKIHEERFIALEILVMQYEATKDEEERKRIFDFYLAHTEWINNWDLVDTSAEYIVGKYLEGKDTTILTKLAHSTSIWERRIAIIATFAFIKKGKFDETLRIAELLLNDKHDLIQKAVGWMLREIGKRDLAVEEHFLKKHYQIMPRTSLRYAIERFPEGKRKEYLNGQI